MLSAICFNFDQSKILSSGNGFKKLIEEISTARKTVKTFSFIKVDRSPVEVEHQLMAEEHQFMEVKHLCMVPVPLCTDHRHPYMMGAEHLTMDLRPHNMMAA